MTFQKAIITHFCLLGATAFLLTSCSSTKGFKKWIKEDDIQIPVGFGKKEGTMLVVMKGKRRFDRYYEKNFKENYTGKYIFIGEGEDHDPQYKDVTKYPYVFGQDVSYYIRGNPTALDVDMTKLGSFFIYDRQTHKVYETKKGSSYWALLMKAYIQVLEESRLRNTSKD
jgi:hypothetical protein